MRAKDFIKQLGKRGHLYWDTQHMPFVLYDPHDSDRVVAEVASLPLLKARVVWMLGVPEASYKDLVFDSSQHARAWVEQHYWTGKPMRKRRESSAPWGNGPAPVQWEESSKDFIKGTRKVNLTDRGLELLAASPWGWVTLAPALAGHATKELTITRGQVHDPMKFIPELVAALREHGVYDSVSVLNNRLDWEPYFRRLGMATTTHSMGGNFYAWTTFPVNEAKEFIKQAPYNGLRIKVPAGWEGATNHPFRDVWHDSTFLGIIHRVDDPEGWYEDCPPGHWRIIKIAFWHGSPLHIRRTWPDAWDAARAMYDLMRGKPMGESVEGGAKAFINALPKAEPKLYVVTYLRHGRHGSYGVHARSKGEAETSFLRKFGQDATDTAITNIRLAESVKDYIKQLGLAANRAGLLKRSGLRYRKRKDGKIVIRNPGTGHVLMLDPHSQFVGDEPFESPREFERYYRAVFYDLGESESPKDFIKQLGKRHRWMQHVHGIKLPSGLIELSYTSPVAKNSNAPVWSQPLAQVEAQRRSQDQPEKYRIVWWNQNEMEQPSAPPEQSFELEELLQYLVQRWEPTLARKTRHYDIIWRNVAGIGEAKDFIKGTMRLPKLQTHKSGRQYGRVFRYKNYQVVRHDYEDGSVILSLYYWNPRKLHWRGGWRGEKPPILVRKAGWEELYGPEKLPAGVNWVRYWAKLKRLLDTAPDPAKQRYSAPRLPKPDKDDELDEAKDLIKQIGTPDSQLRQELRARGFRRTKERINPGDAEVWQLKQGRVLHTVEQREEGQAWRYYRNTVPDYNFSTGPEAMTRNLRRYVEAKDFIKQTGLQHLPGLYVQSNFQTWLVNRDGKVLQQWDDDDRINAMRRSSRFGTAPVTDAVRFNVGEYVRRTGDLPRGQRIRIHQIGYWGPGGTYFPCQDECIANQAQAGL